MRRRTFLLVILATALSCADPSTVPPPVPEGAIPAGTALGGSSIRGRVVYGGTPPPAVEVSMASDAACHRRQTGPVTREDLVVGEQGALANVLVRVEGGAVTGRVFAPPATPVTLDQRGCAYRPHVVGVMAGQQLLIVNSDPTLHNVHTVSKENKPFNFGMSVEGQKAPRYFAKPEIVKARCDVHPWMSAFICVSSHPFFAVTGPEGTFTIGGLPAGEHTVEAWQETLGTQRQTVTLGEGETREVVFTFPG